MNRTWAHMFNMFVMRKDYFDEFCAWWFGVMFEVEKRIDLSKYPKPEQRWFIDELLLDVWLETKRYPYYECNVDYFEKQNWVKKGWAFIRRKILGDYFGLKITFIQCYCSGFLCSKIFAQMF